MTEDAPIFTIGELMVLTSVLGASVLYGFEPDEPVGKHDILTAANDLLCRSVLAMDGDAYRIADPAMRELLLPLCKPKAVLYFTPRTTEQPQVCYLLDDERGLCVETVLVQADAVRLAPIGSGAWADDVLQRCSRSGPPDDLPAEREKGYEELGLDLHMSVGELLDACPRCVAALEHIDPQEKRTVGKVILVDEPGGMKTIALSENGCNVTDDLAGAVKYASGFS